MSGVLANTYASSQKTTILGFAKTLITIRSMEGGSGATYRVQATPKQDDSLAPWVTIKSGTSINSGGVVTHKLTDPWDAIRIQAKNTQTNMSSSIIVWVNRDPR